MVDIKNIPAKLKSDCRFCVWKFEKRSGQKTKMPYNPANGDRARINDLRTFADFKTTLMSYAMGGYDGIGIAVGNGIGAFDMPEASGTRKNGRPPSGPALCLPPLHWKIIRPTVG